MPNLALLGAVPNLRGAVHGDRSGALLGVVGQIDGESAAAVSGFLSSTLSETGDHLGLGELRRILVTGTTGACLLGVQGQAVIAAFLGSPTSSPTIDKALDAALQG